MQTFRQNPSAYVGSASVMTLVMGLLAALVWYFFGQPLSSIVLGLAVISGLLLAAGGRDRPVIDTLGMVALLASTVGAFFQVGLGVAVALFFAIMFTMMAIRPWVSILTNR